MRILHTSDIHLEAPMTRFPAAKVRERKNELFATFERLVNEASGIGCRVVIIAGDLFDGERITAKAADRVANIIEGHPEVEFLYLPGNHERVAFINRIARTPKNLKVFGEGWTYFDYEGVRIAGRTEIAPDMFDTLSLVEGEKNIVVLHGGIADGVGGDETIGLAAARGRGIDYMALGHYHSYSVTSIDERGVAVYSGTPEGRGFDEAGECGFVLLDTGSERITHRFCQFAKRTIEVIPVDISEATRRMDIEELVRVAVEKISPRDIVRVVLTGARLPDLYADLDALSERYQDRFYYFEVKDDTRTKIDPEAYRYDKSLEGEFIRLVYSKDDLTDEAKEKIIRCGLGALLGEECEI